ncbi:hypothetical protein IIU_05110 [Bacillus cereus VD133]|uniref:Uncharacterized protein n=1 Tax=Bacillus cereus VD133 TaxID=1053233 RepID=A0A9W5V0L3_BACCE|nr:hypothetical protein [Bacillus cereus]EOO30364.1 hypothetical protein IIU_05110 [Bacillus cereus VD133]
MGYMNRKKYGQVSTSSSSGSCGGSCNNSCSGCDECREQYEECKNQQNQTCDCCCVQGIKDELSSLINQIVRIDTETRSYVGVVTSVTCDVIRLGASAGTVATIISICKIEAVIPATTTVVNGINLDDTEIANKV